MPMIQRKCKEFRTFILHLFPAFNKPPQPGLGFCQSHGEPRLATSFSLVGLHTSVKLYYNFAVLQCLSFSSSSHCSAKLTSHTMQNVLVERDVLNVCHHKMCAFIHDREHCDSPLVWQKMHIMKSPFCCNPAHYYISVGTGRLISKTLLDCCSFIQCLKGKETFENTSVQFYGYCRHENK